MRLFIKAVIHTLLFIPGKLGINPFLDAKAFLQEFHQKLIVRIGCQKQMELFIILPNPLYIHRLQLHPRRIIYMGLDIRQMILDNIVETGLQGFRFQNTA